MRSCFFAAAPVLLLQIVLQECACLLHVTDGLDIALDNTVGAVKAFFLAETVENPLGRVLLLLPDMLVLRQPF
ncbi:hypothetical protein [Mitsuokella sp. AF21-1AC]|uniref:hypothetical protein n=1 Tax=Mitsuokella sp. AF21-1AC TaxID=2292235 RepID=UPI000E494E1C|nr:hypothetical protein [Mitsuokella sp. AF21-1AC]RGS69377.1 hypothetical protein DWX75_11940 [Mitsuokella sp. AF21-1AC]